MLGGGSSPLPLPPAGGSSVGSGGSGGFGSLHQHERMVGLLTGGAGAGVWAAPRWLPRDPLPRPQGYQLHGTEVNGGLPAVPTFSAAPTAAYGSVSNHTPPVSGADSLMGTGPLLPTSR